LADRAEFVLAVARVVVRVVVVVRVSAHGGSLGAPPPGPHSSAPAGATPEAVEFAAVPLRRTPRPGVTPGDRRPLDLRRGRWGQVLVVLGGDRRRRSLRQQAADDEDALNTAP